ncbi:MAG: hypothetical protein AAF085_00650 [Planctomycetota bacterium]
MDRADEQTQPEPSARKRPSRKWYLLSLAVLVVSLTVFIVAIREKFAYLYDQIEPMPRFVGPTGEEGVVISIEQPGKQNIFYENRGSLDGKTFDTPRRQVWTTYEAPAMACTFTLVETGEILEIRLPGLNEAESKSRTSEDQIVAYDIDGMQGHTAWVFDMDQPGEVRIELSYNEAVFLDPGDVEIPPELTKAEKKEMLEADGTIYEAERRVEIEKAALAELEPIDVLFAVGPDPTRGSFFEVFGLKGAATLLAFGFTFAALTSLVTLMLRGGYVTPRGEMDAVRRFGDTQA